MLWTGYLLMIVTILAQSAHDPFVSRQVPSFTEAAKVVSDMHSDTAKCLCFVPRLQRNLFLLLP